MAWALVLVGSWGALGLLLAGVGLLVGRALDGERAAAGEAPEAFWLGWAGALALLQPLQLVVPSGPWFLLVLLPFSAAGWLVGVSRSPGAPPGGPRPRVRLLVPGLLLPLCLGLLALAALKPPLFYDSSLYHLQAIRWVRTFRDVPGLVNLHFRLGFASAEFPFVAALEPGIGPLRGYHLANGLLLAVFLAGLASRLARTRDAHGDTPDMLDLVSWAAAFSAFRLASSPDTDTPLLLVGLVLARSVVSPTPRRLAAAPVLAAAGVALKLSSAPFGLFLVAAALGPRLRMPPAGRRRPLLSALALTVLILAGWSARSAVLSGHLAFPLRFTALPVDFRARADLVKEAIDGIRGWARVEGPGYTEAAAGWWWVPGWTRRTLRDPLVLATVVCSTGWLAAALLLRRKGGRERTLSDGQRRLLAATLAALAVWFVGAPDPRFARAPAWVLLALAMDGGAGRTGLGPRPRTLLALAGTGLLSAYFLAYPGVFPKAPLGARPGQPLELPVQPFALPSGLVVGRPVLDDRCGDAPLPCTPFPDPRLRLRDPLRLEAGFLR